ncbi:hypothetical protein D3C85_14120 [compost metagenome]
MSQGLSTRPVGKVRIYGCGGGGVNIGKEYLETGHSADLANIEVCFVDTSDSNLEDRLVDRTWLFTDLDGSGAIRNSNDKTIAKHVPDILRKFAPGDVNIVIFTLAGGTGSVAGPLILKQLLEDGHLAIAVVIGAKQSLRNAENTIASVKTLDHIAKVSQKPVVMHLGFNASRSVSDADVDREAHGLISALSVLCSRRNHGLDTADLRSFFDFTQSTVAVSQMALIHVTDNVEYFDKTMANCGLSAAYLLREKNDEVPGTFVPYSTYGIMPNIAQFNSSLFFGIENGTLSTFREHVQQLQKEIDMQKRTTSEVVGFLGNNDQISDTGMVF